MKIPEGLTPIRIKVPPFTVLHVPQEAIFFGEEFSGGRGRNGYYVDDLCGEEFFVRNAECIALSQEALDLAVEGDAATHVERTAPMGAKWFELKDYSALNVEERYKEFKCPEPPEVDDAE